MSEETRAGRDNLCSAPSLKDRIYLWCDEADALYNHDHNRKLRLGIDADDFMQMYIASSLEMWHQERENGR